MRLALDVGTGVAGAVTGKLIKGGWDGKVIAIDTPPILDRAKDWLTRDGVDLSLVEFLACDVALLPLPDDSADLITPRFWLSTVDSVHPFGVDACLRQLYRVLKPGGKIELADYGPLNLPTSNEAAIQCELWYFDKMWAMWQGGYPLKEHPPEWVVGKMTEMGFQQIKLSTNPAYWDMKWLDEYTRNMRINFQRLPRGLAEGALQRFNELAESAYKLIQANGAIVNGVVYTITATK